MKLAVALLCGVVFGAGLSLSGMTNPAKVLAFLDVSGSWDPTLALVMGGGLAVSVVGYRIAGGRDRAWLGEPFAIPTLGAAPGYRWRYACALSGRISGAGWSRSARS